MGEERGGVGPELDRSDDLTLLAELRGMLDRVDPPPVWLAELARQSYGLRSVDLEIAEVVADSQVDRPAAAVRGPSGAGTEPRLLSFEAEGLLIDLQISYGARGPEVSGQLVPGSTATVELRQPGRPVRLVEADEHGRFAAPLLDAGPFILVVTRPGSTSVASPWMMA